MNIGIVGAGRLGCALAVTFVQKGHVISGVYGRSKESADYIINRLGLGVNNDLKETVDNSQIIFITVSDKAIRAVSDEINVLFNDLSGKVFFHCSGSLSSEELAELNSKGAAVGSLHPIQTFADRENSYTGLKDIFFGFEGNPEAGKFAEILVKELNSKLLCLHKEDKILYHTAACILSNYTTVLFYTAEKLFERIGLKGETGIEAYMPLVLKTIDNIKDTGSLNSLTGPISRGDSGTVMKHMEELKEKEPELLELYRVLGLVTCKAALEKKSINSDVYMKIKDIFEKRLSP